MNPIRYTVGQQVIVTKDNWQAARNSNRSILAYPSDSVVHTIYGLMKNQTAGTVERLFLPGYEVNVKFSDGTILQMKDSWVSPLPDYDPLDFVQ